MEGLFQMLLRVAMAHVRNALPKRPGSLPNRQLLELLSLYGQSPRLADAEKAQAKV